MFISRVVMVTNGVSTELDVKMVSVFPLVSLRFFDVVLTDVSHSLFEDSENVTMDFTVLNLAQFNLNLNGVTFQQNKLCISVKSISKVQIFLGITNSSFIQNGNFSSSGLPSIIWLTGDKSEINIAFVNCGFRKNKFNGYGMIFVENRVGSTNLFLDRFSLEDNVTVLVPRSREAIMVYYFSSLLTQL